jgi:predicted enzyme related to lactoylglutathione lyase
VGNTTHVGFRAGESERASRPQARTEGLGTGPGGTLAYWQVEDVPAAFERLLSLGAKPLQPRAELSSGFMIASVVDPFGNVLGLRFDPQFQVDHGTAE